MTCSQEIIEIVAEMLQTGIVRIRAAAWGGDAKRCALEADHLHNLPDLLRDYTPAKLEYYWDTERPSFLSRLSEFNDQAAAYAPLWQRLALVVNRGRAPAAAK